MTKKNLTPMQVLEASANMDCSPRFEAIVAHNRIVDLWVYSNGKHVVFVASVHKQFVGTMHKDTAHETEWTEEHCGLLEDGQARKGQTLASEAFFDIRLAMEWVQQQSLAALEAQYGSLDDSANLAV